MRNSQYTNAALTAKEAKREITQGLKILSKIDRPIISFFGSARTRHSSAVYKHCEQLAYTLGSSGFAIMSGGGPGIMHAANRGATRACAPSIGFTAALLEHEAVNGQLWTAKLGFHFLFVRRFLLAIESEALVFYPGGFGTMNELYEYLTLQQTGMVEKVPIILVGKKYWKGMQAWLQGRMLKDGMISKKDLALIRYADTHEEIIGIIGGK
jgi:uncharacterized protein (TIGR00730 family)